MKKEALRMEHVSCRGGVYELYSCSLSVLQGEIVGVIGLRNSGISEMFKILSGKDVYQGGSIYLEERLMRPYAFTHPELLGVAVIHCSSALNQELTVAENIILINHLKKKVGLLRERVMNEQVSHLLHSLGIEIPVHIKARGLTLAQQHMILIARAVYEGDRIILLENIQRQYSRCEIDMLGWLIRRTARRGISYVCKYYHDSYMLKYMDKLTFLRGGVTAGEYEQKYFTDMGSVRDMLGQPKNIVPENANWVSGKEILRVKNLCTVSNNVPVDFSICEGETVVLLDEKGKRGNEITSILSGKDASFYLSGKIYVDQQAVPITFKKYFMKKWTAFMPENAAKIGLLENMTILDNVLLMKLAAGQWGFRYIRKRISMFTAKEFLATLPEKSRIKYDVDIKVRELDEKERYELLFYINLKNHPRLFIMENPLAYSDEATRALLSCKILELNKIGIGVLLETNDMSSIPEIKCKILKLHPSF